MSKVTRGVIKITEYDWDRATNVVREYSPELFEEFIDYFFRTKRWEEDLYLVQRQVQKLREKLSVVRHEREREERAERQAVIDERKRVKALEDRALRIMREAGV